MARCFSCSVCGKEIPRELLSVVGHYEGHIIDEIKKKHPQWVESDSLCNKCYKYYKKQIHSRDS